MMFLKKVLSIVSKACAGLFVFYLFCALALIPLFSPWLIKSQGSKFLKTPVSVRGVYFNPFLWSLNVVGLEVTDHADQKLLGFDKFRIDVSFKDFLKKMAHVESVQLDGLFVHASLLEDGKIDLVNLVPAATAVPAQPAQPQTVQPLPSIVIDKIVLQKGFIQFDDRSVNPVFKTALSQMELTVTGFSTQPESITKIDFKAFLDEKGLISAQAQLKPLQQPLELELNLGLDQYALTVTSPYVGKYTGRGLADGKLDFNTTYRISNNKLKASHKILIQRFNFGEKVESKDALNLPFGFAVALLEDPQGRISISLPVEGDLNDPQFRYTHLIWQTVRNFFTKLITKPFSMLGSMLGASSDSGTDELGLVRFLPGRSDLAPEELNKLMLLAKGLNDRPRLLLEVNGSYDLTQDWKAIKTEQFDKDYAALKKETSKDENWILQSLYQRRFGIRQLWKLTNSFKTRTGYEHEKLNAEIKRHLGEDAFPDKVALTALAQERANNVLDIILKEHVDPRRVKIGIDHEVQASMGFVPMEFTLTVFDEPKAANLTE
ncbi:MAG: DUF748 domain-containing protein [Candidatus Omnitrophica bacterium]|nr:DUF748 domain-containing protein [Candidatus Omnitrophota bacterium]